MPHPEIDYNQLLHQTIIEYDTRYRETVIKDLERIYHGDIMAYLGIRRI